MDEELAYFNEPHSSVHCHRYLFEKKRADFNDYKTKTIHS